MNEFQAILTVVVYFVVRIGVPALLITPYSPDPTLPKAGPARDEAPETRVAH
jgi:hypothetical protein